MTTVGAWVGLIVLSLTGALAGCSNYACTDIGCSSGLKCNPRTGSCEQRIQSCEQTGCPDGQRCDEASGVCRSQGTRCVDNSCPARQVCNAQTGYCEARSNCQLDPCTSTAEQCDPVSGRCVPKSCTDDAECPTAYYCADSKRCRAGCRVGDESSCPDGEFCRANADDPVGRCRQSCRDDHECPLGQLCQQTPDGTTCEPEPACSADRDCRGKGVCLQHRCLPPPCTQNEDCSADQVCDRATGTCIGGSCTEDIHAPNQAIDQATELDPDQYADLQLCPGTSDWFALTLRTSDTLELRLEHPADADLDMYVYDANGYLLAANQQTGPVTHLQFVSQRTQTATLQVTSGDLGAHNYDLSIARNPADAFCEDDTSEENDRPAQATVLPTDTAAPFESSLQLCGADPDWFVLSGLDADNGLTITVSAEIPNMKVDLLGPQGGRQTATKPNPSGPAGVHIDRLGVAGDYYLHAWSPSSRPGAYELGTRVVDPLVCRQSQMHNTPATAIPIDYDSPHTADFCPLDDTWEVDWLALQPPAQPAVLTAQVSAVGDLPGLDVVVFRQTPDGPKPVRRARRIDAEYRLEVPAAANTQYLLRLSAEGTPGRIVDGVSYRAVYRYESAP